MTNNHRTGRDIDRGLIRYWKLDDLKGNASDGIVAHYKMNDDAASTNVVDFKSGATATAAQNTSGFSVVGKINDALDFNGSTDKVVVTGFPDVMSTSAGSISLWINQDALVTHNEYVLGFSTGDKMIIRIVPSDDGSNPSKVMFILKEGVGWKNAYSDSAITAATWHHVVVTWTATSMVVYLDGTAGTPVSRTASNFDFDNLYIGTREEEGATDFFDGKIDDVRIYNKTLSQSEVNSINNSDSGTETTELFRTDPAAIEQVNFVDGTIIGATNGDGINGLNADSMFFDGVDDEVSIPHTNLGGNPFSFSAWIYLDGRVDSKNHTVFDSDLDYAGNKGTMWQIRQGDDGADSYKQRLYCGNTVFNSDTASPTNEWVHIAVVQTATTTYFYLNGEQDGTAANAIEGESVGQNLDYIGSESNANHFFKGRISNMRIYNRILTDGEISKLYRLKK